MSKGAVAVHIEAVGPASVTEATAVVREMRELVRDEDGTATVEYALLLSLVIIASVAAWQNLSDTLANVLRDSTNTIATGGNN